MATRESGSDSKDTRSSSSSNTQSDRSTGSNSNSTPSTSRAQSTSSSSSSSSSPSIRAGSDTQDNRGADTSGGRSSGNDFIGSSGGGGSNSGIAAAASTGAQTGNRSNTQSLADRVDRSPSSAASDWLMLQDQLDALTPGIAYGPTQSRAARDAALSALSVPGIGTTWEDFQRNVRNGSMGMPGAIGYGTDPAPAAPSVNVFQQLYDFLQGPYNRRVEANGGVAPFSGAVDWQGIHDALQAPYQRRVDANGGVAPFEGPIDTAGIIHELNGPYYRRLLRENADLANGVLPDTPLNTATAAPGSLTWQEMRARLLSGDRLPTERRVPTTVVAPAYGGETSVVARTINPDGSYSAPLGAIDTAVTDQPVVTPAQPDVFASDGQVVTPDGRVVRPGVPAAQNASFSDADKPATEPSTWDKIVDNTGKLLSHTGLGALISGIFPDAWNGMGDAFKGLGNGNPGTAGAITPYDPSTDTEIADRANQRVPSYYDFLDANGNGIDDRLEGVPATGIAAGTPTTDQTGYSGNQFRSNRYATFPTMPPYRPGVDDEWNYFHDHLARGGVVGYQHGDPRITLIADAEDALHRGDHQHPSLDKFVDTFGPKALENLHTNVRAGMRMRAGLPARQVIGPGGPTDDAVPAVIDGVHPAKLSSGEVVIPVDAVKGAGNGDPKVGADRLMNLAARLAGRGDETDVADADIVPIPKRVTPDTYKDLGGKLLTTDEMYGGSLLAKLINMGAAAPAPVSIKPANTNRG